ncbi:MAG: hypothetical protein IKS42_09465 [Oscillospiraceae bacterium]|nr:hypothetical protein [Oscillospiraceae bacterium]
MKKKKKFIKFFLWRFAVCALAMLAVAGYYLVYPIYNVRIYDYGRSWENVKERYIDTAISSIEKRGDLRKALADLSKNDSGGYYECGVMLYRPETGEAYISHPLGTAIVRINGEYKILYNEDEAMLDRMHSMSLDSYCVIVADIYAKDDTFVPGKVFQQELPLFSIDIEKPRPGEWVDLAPADTEGWTHITSYQTEEQLTSYYENDEMPDTLPETFLYSTEISGSCNSPHINPVLRDNLKAYQQEYQIRQQEYQNRASEIKRLEEKLAGTLTAQDLSDWGAETAEECRSSIENYLDNYRVHPEELMPDLGANPWKYADYNIGTSDITLNGEEWKLMHAEYFDSRAYCKSVIRMLLPYYLLAALIAVLIGAALAFLWALVSYLIYSKRYDMAAYRRTLTGALAHDLKTPLTAISGYAENLRDHTHPDKADAYADCILENVQHMDSMIAGTLGLAELESRDKIEMQEVDLTALIADAFEKVQPVKEQRGLTVELSGTCTVRGNAEMLRQLALNLAANAAQHAAEGGKITVTGEGRTLRMQNPFAGELDEKAILEPFKRGSKARGRESGSGLGLSIVQQIAALHRAKLRVTARDGVFTAELRFRK